MTRKRLEAYQRTQKKKGWGEENSHVMLFIHITRSATDDGWTWASTRQKNPAPQQRGGSTMLLTKGAEEARSDVSDNAVACPPIRSAAKIITCVVRCLLTPFYIDDGLATIATTVPRVTHTHQTLITTNA